MQLIRVALCLSVLWLGACDARHEAKQTSADEIQTEHAQSEQAQPAATAIATADQSEAEAITPQAAPASFSPDEQATLPARQFIRTANVKFQVDNVAKATSQIETITKQQVGFVTFTKLDSQIDDKETVPISADSLLETTRYTVSNTMTLRVPNARLDTTLQAIASLGNYLDIREIKSDDVALQRLAAGQARRRIAAHDARLRRAIDGRGRKLGETTEAEESRLNGQRESDEAQINDFSLADQIQYSTVTLNLYQRQTILRTMLPNTTDVRVYEPGFFTQAADALAAGAGVLEGFVLFLLRGWGLLLFSLLVFVLAKFGIRRWRLAKA
ncbi:DUF4349 domain-containing protein [Fibrella sp. HMF5335]|uniref:DUF4349 domain-containing protein n=1 Tax=Fibrella rubiginis TaxID=2817060 RepID=A0A939GI27_9BACT|nr:DUF4349 domain-containing protein [Fibrella rubiginis]MBO0939454.1 DUF4349 domain-containing protein [Fibrella rubiginis]